MNGDHEPKPGPSQGISFAFSKHDYTKSATPYPEPAPIIQRREGRVVASEGPSESPSQALTQQRSSQNIQPTAGGPLRPQPANTQPFALGRSQSQNARQLDRHIEFPPLGPILPARSNGHLGTAGNVVSKKSDNGDFQPKLEREPTQRGRTGPSLFSGPLRPFQSSHLRLEHKSDDDNTTIERAPSFVASLQRPLQKEQDIKNFSNTSIANFSGGQGHPAWNQREKLPVPSTAPPVTRLLPDVNAGARVYSSNDAVLPDHPTPRSEGDRAVPDAPLTSVHVKTERRDSVPKDQHTGGDDDGSEEQYLNIISLKAERIKSLEERCQHLKAECDLLNDKLVRKTQELETSQEKSQQDQIAWRTSINNARSWREKVKQKENSKSQTFSELQKSFQAGTTALNASVEEVSREVRDWQNEEVKVIKEEITSHTDRFANMKSALHEIKAQLQTECSSRDELVAVKALNKKLQEDEESLLNRCKELEGKLQLFEESLTPKLDTVSTELIELNKKADTGITEGLIKYQDELHKKYTESEKQKWDDLKEHLRSSGCEGDDPENMIDQLLVNHKSDLDEKERDLRRAHRDSEERVLRSSKEITSLQKDLDSHKSKLGEAERQLRQAQRDLADQRATFTAERQTAEQAFRREVEVVKNERQLLNDDLDKARSDLRTLHDQMTVLSAEKKTRDSEIQSSRTREKSLDAQAKKSKHDLEAALGHIAALQTELNKQGDLYRQTTAEESAALQNEIERLKNELDLASKRTNTTHLNRITALEGENQKLQEKLTTAQQDVASARDMAKNEARLQKEVNETKFAKQVQQIKDLKNENSRLEAELKKCKAMIAASSEGGAGVKGDTIPSPSSPLTDPGSDDDEDKETSTSIPAEGDLRSVVPKQPSRSKAMSAFKPPTMSHAPAPQHTSSSSNKRKDSPVELDDDDEFRSPTLEDKAMAEILDKTEKRHSEKSAKILEVAVPKKKAKLAVTQDDDSDHEVPDDIEGDLEPSSSQPTTKPSKTKTKTKTKATATGGTRSGSNSTVKTYSQTNKKKGKGVRS
nr:uncharacterized protein CI109_004683 [Kwoniella shandongensis]KAA5526907.1 hypothetical protein CI109_004683 [Kwoniella shandongensis]